MKTEITKEMEDQFLSDAEISIKAPRSEQKVRITTMVDGDVLDQLKALAKNENIGYQTLLNRVLRKSLFARNDNDIIINALRNIIERNFPSDFSEEIEKLKDIG